MTHSSASESQLPTTILPNTPATSLAPMQSVTDLPFMEVVTRCGAPDYFFTEFFRIHPHSRLEPHILRSITENTSGRPVFAQIIGECPDLMTKAARELAAYPIAGIDLNMGCPAPKIYKKNVGGGLLRDPQKIDLLLGRLRDSIDGLFTVKTRIGFDGTENFDAVLNLVNKHEIDLLSVHGRTVKEGYRSEVHYDFIKRATETVACPVHANGNIVSARKAVEVLQETGCAGLMIGRSAIRNPWIFRQIRERMTGSEVFRPTLTDVREYIDLLYHATRTPDIPEQAHVSKMKKYLNFIGQSVDEDGKFLYEMRRAFTETDLFEVCDRHLLTDGNRLFEDEPFDGVIARPNCETPLPAATR